MVNFFLQGIAFVLVSGAWESKYMYLLHVSFDCLCAEQSCPLNFRLCTVDWIKYGKQERHAKCQMINVCPTIHNLYNLTSSMIWPHLKQQDTSHSLCRVVIYHDIPSFLSSNRILTLDMCFTVYLEIFHVPHTVHLAVKELLMDACQWYYISHHSTIHSFCQAEFTIGILGWKSRWPILARLRFTFVHGHRGNVNFLHTSIVCAMETRSKYAYQIFDQMD